MFLPLVYLWDASDGPVTSVKWAPDGRHIAVGLNNSEVRLWDSTTNRQVMLDTGSQVCSLLWSKNERELLTSHGFTQNQLTLWKYPSMVKIAELTGHTSRVLFMSQSPDGCTVASAAGDETLRFWNSRSGETCTAYIMSCVVYIS